MTRYSRSVIPGRPQPDERSPGGELDRAVFGRRADGDDHDDDGDDAPAGGRRRKAADPVADNDDPPERLFTERAPANRRAKSGGRRKADYSPLSGAKSDDAGYRPPEDSRRGPLILIVTLVVIGVFGAVVWNAYSKGVRTEGGATPELAAAGPFKSRPAPEDAKAAADVDASVFERVETAKKPAEAASTPEVRPEPPKAELAKAAEAPPAPAAKPAPVAVAPVHAAAVQKPATPPVQMPAKPAEAKALETKVVESKPAEGKPIDLKPAASAARPADVKPVDAPKPTLAKTAAASPAPAAAAVPLAGEAKAGASSPAFSASGKYVVQLAAPSTEAAALAEWDKRAKAAPGLMQGAEKTVVRAEVNGKTVYRLRAGSFAAPADADAFCAAIKASGGACFRATK